MSLVSSYAAILALHVCEMLEITLNAVRQLIEAVVWAKYKSNNACVGRRGGVLSPTGHIFRPFK